MKNAVGRENLPANMQIDYKISKLSGLALKLQQFMSYKALSISGISYREIFFYDWQSHLTLFYKEPILFRQATSSFKIFRGRRHVSLLDFTRFGNNNLYQQGHETLLQYSSFLSYSQLMPRNLVLVITASRHFLIYKLNHSFTKIPAGPCLESVVTLSYFEF